MILCSGHNASHELQYFDMVIERMFMRMYPSAPVYVFALYRKMVIIVV